MMIDKINFYQDSEYLRIRRVEKIAKANTLKSYKDSTARVDMENAKGSERRAPKPPMSPFGDED
jgi:hypothetical protein